VNDQPSNRDLPPTLNQPPPSDGVPPTRGPDGTNVEIPLTVPPTLETPVTVVPSAATIGTTPEDDSSRLLPSGYEPIRRLGRGGMGVVYLARHAILGRLVALKLVREDAHVDTDYRQRFQREAEAVAKLHHLGVVQIHDVGVHRSRPFFSMEYCAGGSLADHLRGGPFVPETAAAVLEKVARAIHHAHQNGIIHRDLKPDNIFLQDASSAPPKGNDADRSDDPKRAPLTADVMPKVADFGLARKLVRRPVMEKPDVRQHVIEANGNRVYA
jgi:serine/threonine protein kinase